jgi:predicted chitinase
MTTREQLFMLLRNLRWLIAISVVISVLLFLPDQIRELYRIAAADAGWIAAKEFIAILLISITIWLGALQLTTETLVRIPAPTGRAAFYFGAIPVVVGVLPVLAAMLGQLASRPGNLHLSPDQRNVIEEVGSIFRVQARAFEYDRFILLVFFAALLAIAILSAIVMWRSGAKGGLITFSRRTNETYFFSFRFFLLTISAIIALTVMFVAYPDRPAQFVGTFGVIALFTLCVTAFTVHLSLLTIEHSFPYLPAIFAWALLVAAIGNDDHEVRLLTDKALIATSPRVSAVSAFDDWLKQPDRVAEAARIGEYPVFIVSAQGGGIYAAHNAAKFLARMQDLCPTFRRHLFAVSSVSGGSVGAAVFAAALNADSSATVSHADPAQACPRIAAFLAGTGREQVDTPGPVEERVESILTTDFLAPLTAGFLFTDFTQNFLPFSFPIFDRARFLEYTLENAADRAAKSESSRVGPPNLLKSDYQSHWTPGNELPALLLNATDVGSGKRVVFSPFDIDESHPKGSDLCIFADLNRHGEGADAKVESSTLHIPLSAAAFISARFPWVTPAATVKLKNDCITENRVAHLVDGGYIDNSGLETALSLIGKIRNVQGTSDAPKFRTYLLSLAGGDFPDHGSFSFGEVMEPIRALLSTRSSRAYIALNRAAQDDRQPLDQGGASVPSIDTFGRSDIKDLFYNLPLGWTLSDKTRDIVSLSSGRFWDCLPNSAFTQSRSQQSNADCLQIRVFHLLNGSVAAAFQAQRDSETAEKYVTSLDGQGQSAPKLDHQGLLACYEAKWFQEDRYKRYLARLDAYEQQLKESAKQNVPPPKPLAPYREGYIAYFQAEQVKALLQEWDSLKETDPRILAYVLGSVSYDSADFVHTSENLSFSSVSQIPKAWLARIDKINADRTAKGDPPIDVNKLLNHPVELDNTIWGSDEKDYGNIPGSNDGWDFRPRGMYQLVGREQYARERGPLQKFGQIPNLDITVFPDALWNAKISAKVTFAHFQTFKYRGHTLFELLQDKTLNWAAVRGFQSDMDHAASDQTLVEERSEMFSKCIEDVSTPSAQSLAKRLLNFL